MILKRKAKGGKVRYAVRVYRDGRFRWVGTYGKLGTATGDPELEAKAAEACALSSVPKPEAVTVDEYVARYLADYERRHKASSYDTARASLKPFREKFAGRELRSITRFEAKDWAARVPPSRVPMVVTVFNQAVEDELIERNPFRGLGRRTKGRSQDRPPTEEELARLLDACSVHGWYAPQMRALIVFAAYSGMRPGELFALEWRDVDMDRMRVQVKRRLYRGSVDLPKSNKAREIALTPPARDALLGLAREDDLVFHGKRGQRLAQSTLSNLWGKVLARAGLDFDFYLATKHYCVHFMWVKLNLPERVIAEQMGWSAEETGRAIKRLLAVYGHGEIGALDEIDRAFSRNVTPLRPVSDANETQTDA